MGPNPKALISKFTILDKILKNLGFIAIWADSSYSATHIFPTNSDFEKIIASYSIFHILDKPHFVEFLDLMPSAWKSRCKLAVWVF